MLNVEKEIIKSILVLKEKVEDLIEKVSFKKFNDPVNQTVFYIVKKYYKKYKKFPNKTEVEIFLNENLDKIDLPADTEQRKFILEKINELFEYLDKSENEVDVLNYEQLKDELEKLLKRKTLVENIEKLKEVLKEGKSIDKFLDKIKDKVSKFDLSFDKGKDIDWFIKLEKPVRKNLRPTGFEYLDFWMEGGLADGELAMIGASSGSGKSWFMCILANNIARAIENSHILYITLEQPEEQIWSRILSNLLEINSKSFIDALPRDVILQAVAEKENLTIDDIRNHCNKITVKHFLPTTSIFEIKNFILKFHKELKKENENILFTVFLDYVNEISYPRKEKWEALELICTELDKLAVDNDIAIYIAAQAHSKRRKNANYFRVEDLYGAKVGLVKKLSFGIGLLRDKEAGVTTVNFFKNRLYGEVEGNVKVSWDKNKSQLTMEKVVFIDNEKDEIDLNDIDINSKEDKKTDSNKENNNELNLEIDSEVFELL